MCNKMCSSSMAAVAFVPFVGYQIVLNGWRAGLCSAETRKSGSG